MATTGHKENRCQKNEVAIASVHGMQQGRARQQRLNILQEILNLSACGALVSQVPSKHHVSISDPLP